MTKVTAISMFSGGLDSILATKLVQHQGIRVVALYIKTPFIINKKDGSSEAKDAANQLMIPMETLTVDNTYLKMIRKPTHGYGKNLNPCVDCKIFMLKKAKQYAKKIGADFIFTGDVLGERPMSQHFPSLKIIDEEAGLKGKILRPLSAKLLPESVAEKKGLVDRSNLLDIKGRSRKQQLKLAKEYGLSDFPSPSGGCLLTCEEYSKKLFDLFEHKKRISMVDITLLKVGRHFRLGNNKIIVGRNEAENIFLLSNKGKTDYFFELTDIVGPISLLQGIKTSNGIKTTAELTAFYSDSKDTMSKVRYGRTKLERTITVSLPQKKDVDQLRVGTVK